MTSTAIRPFCEEAAGGVRVGGRDAQAGQILDRLVRRSPSGRRRRAGTGHSRASRRRGSSAPVSARRSIAGDAEVGHAVADELDDVVRADEEDVEVEVLDARDEAAVVLLEDEAGVVEQRERRLDEPALVRDRQAEPSRPSSRSSAPRRGRGCPASRAAAEPVEASR